MYINKLVRYFRPSAILILTLGVVACGGGGGSDSGAGNNNVTGTIQFNNTTHNTTEGTDTSVTITVTRTDGSSGVASADYVTSDNSATNPSDYSSTNGTLTWADGDSAPKTFSVTISNDVTVEPTEDFSVSLINVAGASLGANSSATVAIIDSGVIQGKFIDAIAGLRYASGSQSGFTDAIGAFNCKTGSSISFYVGDILIGTAVCSALISPVDMVPGATDETHPTVSNIFAFLQTIDDDNDLKNGITITQAVRDAATSQSLDFDQTTADFAADLNVLNVVASLTAATTFGAHSLVGASDAESDLNSILLTALNGIYNGAYTCDACDANGTWSMTITDGSILGSVCNVDTQLAFAISGTITSSGNSTIDAAGIGGNGQFSGTVSLDGEFDGTWSTADSGGPLIGSRQGISVGGTCILPGGNLDITGADTGTIGLSFEPAYDGLSRVTETQINIVALDINPFTSPGVDYRTLEIVFSTDGTPLGILFGLYSSGTLVNEYITICSQDDCSGASIDTDTQTITLGNVVVSPTNMLNNNATGTLLLDGSFTYTILTP